MTDRRNRPHAIKIQEAYEKRMHGLLDALEANTLTMHRSPAIVAILDMRPLEVNREQFAASAEDIARLLPYAGVLDVIDLMMRTAQRGTSGGQTLADIPDIVRAAVTDAVLSKRIPFRSLAPKYRWKAWKVHRGE